MTAIDSLLKSKDIPPKKLSTLDDACVGALLRQRNNLCLIQIHCITHRVALAAGQACRDVTYFAEYQLANVYHIYHLFISYLFLFYSAFLYYILKYLLNHCSLIVCLSLCLSVCQSCCSFICLVWVMSPGIVGLVFFTFVTK